METLTNWLLAMVNPLVARVLASVGISVVTIKGVDTAFDQVMGYVQQSRQQLPAEVLQMLGIFGVDTAMGWVLGAISFVFTSWTARKLFSFFGFGGND